MRIFKKKFVFLPAIVVLPLLILYFVNCHRYYVLWRDVRYSYNDWVHLKLQFKWFKEKCLQEPTSIEETIAIYNDDEEWIFQKDGYFIMYGWQSGKNSKVFIAFSKNLQILPNKSGRIYTIGYKFKILPYLKKIPPPENLAGNLFEHIERFKEQPLIPSMYEFPKRLWGTIDMLFFGSRFSTRV